MMGNYIHVLTISIDSYEHGFSNTGSPKTVVTPSSGWPEETKLYLHKI